MLARWLTELMTSGELTPGDRLPREDALAAMLGVSRMTLRQALASLEAAGVLERRAGRLGGTFVRERRIDCDLTGLAGFTLQLRRANVRAGARIVSAETVPASSVVARSLSLRKGSAVHRVVRVRTARREPLAVEHSYFPADTFPDLLTQRLTGSLYELLSRRYGLAPHSASEILEPIIAGPEEARLLGTGSGSPLMQLERTAYTAVGQAIEYARDLFRPDRIRISLRTTIDPAG